MPIAAADAFYQVQKPGTVIYSHGVKPSHASRQFHYISNILFYSYDSQYHQNSIQSFLFSSFDI
jgi:hypothetical protein